MTCAVFSVAATGLVIAQTDAREESAASVERDGRDPSEQRGGKFAREGRPVSLDEFSARRMERLAAADANGDGALSLDEIEDMVLKQMVERRARRQFRRLDVDGDGAVTLSEIQNHRAKRFAWLDRNDDGELDERELSLVMGRDRRHGRGHGRHGGEDMQRGGDGAGYMMMPGRREHGPN